VLFITFAAIIYEGIKLLLERRIWVVGHNYLLIQNSLLWVISSTEFRNSKLELIRHLAHGDTPERWYLEVTDGEKEKTLFQRDYTYGFNTEWSYHPREFTDLCAFLVKHTGWACTLPGQEDTSL
jgi:hypothetical protein